MHEPCKKNIREMFVPRSLLRSGKPPQAKKTKPVNVVRKDGRAADLIGDKRTDEVKDGQCGSESFMSSSQGQSSKDAIVEEKVKAASEHKETPPEDNDTADFPPSYVPTLEERKANSDASDDEAEAIISYSKDQRWPEPGEPVCIMCGRYAEYICEQTDVDICSLECKAKHLAEMEDERPPTEPSDGNDTLTDVDGTDIYKYEEHEEIKQLRDDQIEELRSQLGIRIKGNSVPRPVLEFRHLQLTDKLKENLEKGGYELPTAVQMQVIPAFLCHRDMMVCAHTSTGKTVSFLLPTIVHILNHMTYNPGTHDPLGLVLSPTRELCMQIEDQAKELMKGLPRMKTALLVGGLPLPQQLYRLKKGVQLVVATPGRLRDILAKEGISLSLLKVVIIDEVDTMFHMGFQEQVTDILKDVPDNVQTMLCSATIPAAIEKMASVSLANPIYVSVGEPSMPNEAVKQIIIWVEEPSKKKKLYSILQDPKYFKPPLVVFVESRVGADMLAAAVYKVCGIHCLALHGDKQQIDRTAILQKFLDGDIPVLVCTGLVGRGIDFPKVKMVVNFDMPTTTEQYVHQVGRAGRLGERGTCITFINNGSKYLFVDFTAMLHTQNVPMPPELANSPHLHHQKEKRKIHHQHRKHWTGKRKKGRWGDDSDSD
ncbi:probable ATP-dependent RNA helicase DDX59 [Ptychodera flava]|uniref:probable ATP-dependent RNA helicase DDX59 n=1 Tax=Ptychodera flava TaxID=63121 RepID=UPI00396A9E82